MLRNRRGVRTCVRACAGLFSLLEDRIHCITVLSTVASKLLRPEGPHQSSAGSVAGWAQKKLCQTWMPYTCGTSVKAPCLARVFKSPCQLLSLNNCRQLLADCFGYCFSWPFFLIELTHCIFSSLSLSLVLPFFLLEFIHSITVFLDWISIVQMQQVLGQVLGKS